MVNSSQWMEATMARKAMGESPREALANAYQAITGEAYATYVARKRAKRKAAAQTVYELHCDRAADQRKAWGIRDR